MYPLLSFIFLSPKAPPTLTGRLVYEAENLSRAMCVHFHCTRVKWCKQRSPGSIHIIYSLAPIFSKVDDHQSCYNVGLSEFS